MIGISLVGIIGMALKRDLERHKDILRDNCHFIVDDLDPNNVIDELIQDHLISENAAQRSVDQWVGVEKKTESLLIN